MGGLDLRDHRLIIKKEAMPKGKVHFWLEAGNSVVDVTAAQLTLELYPAHNYANGFACGVGDNRAKQLAFIGTTQYKLPLSTFSVLNATIKRLYS